MGIGKNRPSHKRGIMEYCGFWDIPECPLTHPCFMVKRGIWHELGGVEWIGGMKQFVMIQICN